VLLIYRIRGYDFLSHIHFVPGRVYHINGSLLCAAAEPLLAAKNGYQIRHWSHYSAYDFANTEHQSHGTIENRKKKKVDQSSVK
jgi:hypothetical protein